MLEMGRQEFLKSRHCLGSRARKIFVAKRTFRVESVLVKCVFCPCFRVSLAVPVRLLTRRPYGCIIKTHIVHLDCRKWMGTASSRGGKGTLDIFVGKRAHDSFTNPFSAMMQASQTPTYMWGALGLNMNCYCGVQQNICRRRRI
jgi:hypothetical protein